MTDFPNTGQNEFWPQKLPTTTWYFIAVDLLSQICLILIFIFTLKTAQPIQNNNKCFNNLQVLIVKQILQSLLSM